MEKKKFNIFIRNINTFSNYISTDTIQLHIATHEHIKS